MFVYLESLDDYCHSCGMISLDDDMTDMVRSSYANQGRIQGGGGSKGAFDPLQKFLVYQDRDTLIEQSL